MKALAILMQLKVACPPDSLEYRKMNGNNIISIADDLIEYFGPLIIMIKGSITVDPFLCNCYVKDFLNHQNERSVMKSIDRFKMPEEIDFYSDIKQWIDGSVRHYVMGLIGTADEFDPSDWKNCYYPRVLCGMKGCGKTTLLLFTKTRLEKNSERKCFCIYIRLASRSFGEPAAVNYIQDEIIHKIDDLILVSIAKENISVDKMNRERFKKFWLNQELFDEMGDSTREGLRKKVARQKYLRELHKNKYDHEFENYISYSFDYLKEQLGILPIIMIDDVDRLDSMDTAREIVNRSKGLARKLGDIPVIISAREETVRALDDSDVYAHKISIIPPSFKEVLGRRKEKFNKEFVLDESTSKKLKLNTEDIKNFVNLVIDSILYENTYSRLISFHYDLDILLDIFRCVIYSPFISMEYARDLIDKKQLIPWNVILDSMQRYYYKNFYQQNSFLLNIYDNEGKHTSANTLLRTRLLQVIQYRFRGLNVGISVGQIYHDMTELGYDREDVVRALKAMARQRLISTGKARNEFQERITPEIIPHRAIVFYSNYLLYEYRYLENIVPVTPVNFEVPLDLVEDYSPIASDKKFKMIDGVLYKFAEFIEECEKEEEKKVRDKELFKTITRDMSLSRGLKAIISKRISSIMGKKD